MEEGKQENQEIEEIEEVEIVFGDVEPEYLITHQSNILVKTRPLKSKSQ